MSAAQLAQQAAWIEADLSKVDRTVTPWVIAFSHKSYMMDSTTWALYDFLANHKVDLQFSGHWHQYTRYPPIDSRNGKTVIDSESVSADKKVYTNPKVHPALAQQRERTNAEAPSASFS
jgi:acid phosphatase